MRTRTSISRVRLTAACAMLVGVVAGTACTETGPTGPDGEETAVDVSGTWQFRRLFSTQFGATEITAVLELTQDGSRLSGTSRNGTYKSSLCALGSCFPDFRGVTSGSVSGSVNGTRVVLEFNADDLGEIDRFEGTIVNGSIEGDDWTATPGSGTGRGGDRTAPPAAPTNLNAVVVQTADGPAVDLRWQDNSNDEDGFAVGEGCDGAELETIGETDANVTSGRVPGPFAGTRCTYAVVAFREAGDGVLVSAPSNRVTVTIPPGAASGARRSSARSVLAERAERS